MDPLSDPDDLISSCELESGGLVSMMEGSDSNGSQPSVVPVDIDIIRNKESIHLELVVADKVEGGVFKTLECIAEKITSR